MKQNKIDISSYFVSCLVLSTHCKFRFDSYGMKDRGAILMMVPFAAFSEKIKDFGPYGPVLGDEKRVHLSFILVLEYFNRGCFF